jgi:hypothetical protein
MRKILHFLQLAVIRASNSYKFIAAFLLGILASWLIKDSLTLFLFPGKSFGGRNFCFQSGILIIYILIAYLFFWLLAVIVCSLFPKAALQLRQTLDSCQKSVKENYKKRIYLALLILGLGIGGIFFVNNVLTSIDTHARMFRTINPVPAAAYPVGIDFRVGLYESADVILFGAHYPGFNSEIIYPSFYPPLVSLVGLPFLLLDENSAYLVQIGLLFFGNIASLLIVAWMAKKYLLSDLGLEGTTAGQIALFISFAVLFYTLSSYPFMFSIERGNFDIIALLFSLAAILFLFKFPQKIWLQVIFLSIAAHLKIYPGILFVVLFLKHGKKLIIPAILVNVIFLFILGVQNALGFLQVVFNNTVVGWPDGWVGNHSAKTFAVIIAANFNQTLPSTYEFLAGVFTLIPIILWCVAMVLFFKQKYSERNALYFVMVSIPLMDIIPAISFDYKLVILSSASVLLVALLIRNIIKKFNLMDFLQLAAVMVILLFIGRSYVFFDLSQSIISDKYLWSLSLEVLMVINILKNYHSDKKIEASVKT